MLEKEIAEQKDIDKGREPRHLFLDIETSPEESATWGVRKIDNVLWHKLGMILMVGYKWKGKPVKLLSQTDYGSYTPDYKKEEKMMADVWALFDEADIITGYNGDNFDIKVINARFLKYKIHPPSQYEQVDPLKILRKHTKFPSNKLEDIAVYLDVGHKLQTGGKYLWKGCLEGNKEDWKHMGKYCKQDTVLVEEVAEQVMPWAKSGLNMNFYMRDGVRCPNVMCGSKRKYKHGWTYLRTGKRRQYRCLDCGRRYKGPILKDDQEKIETF